jgi:hypothetical protein
MEHFILGCRCLETVRNPVLHELVTKLKECEYESILFCFLARQDNLLLLLIRISYGGA